MTASIPPGRLREIALRAEERVKTLSLSYPSRSGLNPEVLLRASRFVEDEFVAIGLSPRREEYIARGHAVGNIVVELKGRSSELSCIVIGAHYDTVLGTPGADDNASGIAGLLELASLFNDYDNERTIYLVAFPHEEPPYFLSSDMGSRQFAAALNNRKQRVHGMLALEMLGYGGANRRQTYPFPLMRALGGYPREGNYIALVGNLRSHKLVRALRKSMSATGRIGVESLVAPGFIPPLFLSDHSSFWKYGFPAVMVTDTAFLRNPHYHQATDTYDTLNYDFLAGVVACVYGAVIEVDRSR